MHEDAIVWLPRNMQRAEDYQTTVRIFEEGEEWVMTTESFDTYVHSGGIGRIVYLGRLRLVSE